jgi:HEXXH motif-containing protein
MDDRVLAAVVATHSQALAGSLITTYREQIQSCSVGVVDLIADWCRVPASYDSAWDPAFSRAQLALTTAALDPREVAVRLALRLTETGCPGAWSARIAPTTLRLGGLLLPGVERVQVEGQGWPPAVTVCGENGASVQCVRREPTGQWAAEGVEPLPSVGVTGSTFLLGASAPLAGDGGQQGFEGVQAVDSIDPAMIQRFREAFGLLAAGGPDYLRWVERILRGILVCHREESFRVISGSGGAMPGVIHASYPAGAMDLAEVLVHECAHQYFYMLERVGPVDDGSDPTLYWSPPIRKERPLSRILMAYHALANVRLFYEAVRAERVDDGGYVDRNEAVIMESVARLDEPLRGNPALTRLGRALYEPLARRVATLAA